MNLHYPPKASQSNFCQSRQATLSAARSVAWIAWVWEKWSSLLLLSSAAAGPSMEIQRAWRNMDVQRVKRTVQIGVCWVRACILKGGELQEMLTCWNYCNLKKMDLPVNLLPAVWCQAYDPEGLHCWVISFLSLTLLSQRKTIPKANRNGGSLWMVLHSIFKADTIAKWALPPKFACFKFVIIFFVGTMTINRSLW